MHNVSFEDIEKCKNPKDIFGESDSAHETYKKLAKLCHPDLNRDKDSADRVFKKLNNLWDEYKNCITKPKYSVKIKTKTSEIEIFEAIYDTEYHTYYNCTVNSHQKIIKVIKDAANNDMIDNEHSILSSHKDSCVPSLGQKLNINGKSAVIINDDWSKFFTLEDIIRENPDGIDLRDAAWMFRRMLYIANFANKNGILSGSIVPSNILLNVDNHNGYMPDWGLSTKKGAAKEYVSGIYSKYKDIYPKEVFEKTPVSSTDTYMAAKCMLMLKGKQNWSANTINLLNWCVSSVSSRISSIKEIDEMFCKIIENIYGPRKYRNFVVKSPLNSKGN